ISRVADAGDRRAINIHLTQAGLVIWQDINQCGMRVRERAMHDLSEAEREQLTSLLTRVRDNLSPTGS
ncbi:MAG: MarR family winged helix-turn-helix transcriptional regulator, partial [Luteimonas sp.]